MEKNDTGDFYVAGVVFSQDVTVWQNVLFSGPFPNGNARIINHKIPDLDLI